MVTSHLRLVRKLGEGGMGSVWIADHVGLACEVAVKFIRPSIAYDDPTLVERFRREAAIAAKLKSPHVVKVLDHGLTTHGAPYMAMELLDGESLEDRLQREGLLDPGDVARLVEQTCRVLEEAHARGVVHRDLKPANLFLLDTGYELFTKVLDFGIAKDDGALRAVSVTSTGSMLGSPLYMSPEQFTDSKLVDGRTDLWSLAVVAYRCLTGALPFAGDTMGKVMVAVMQRDYAPLSSAHRSLCPRIEGFFERAFADDVDRRFSTAGELAEALRAAVEAPATPRPSDTVDLANTMALDEAAISRVSTATLNLASRDPDGSPSAVGGTFAPASSTWNAVPIRRRGAASWLALLGVLTVVTVVAISLWPRGGGGAAGVPAVATEVPEASKLEPPPVEPAMGSTPEPEVEPGAGRAAPEPSTKAPPPPPASAPSRPHISATPRVSAAPADLPPKPIAPPPTKRSERGPLF